MRLAFGRFRFELTQLAGAKIESMHGAALVVAIKRVAIRWIEEHIKSIRAGEWSPVGIANAFLARHGTRSHPIAVVLESARDAIRRLRVVQRNSVEFARGNSIQMFPALPSGVTLVNAAIVPDQQTLTNARLRRLVLVFRFWRLRRGHCSRLNRERVTIGMKFLGQIFAEIFSPIIRNEQREPEQIHALIVRWIDPDLAEIKRARIVI